MNEKNRKNIDPYNEEIWEEENEVDNIQIPNNERRKNIWIRIANFVFFAVLGFVVVLILYGLYLTLSTPQPVKKYENEFCVIKHKDIENYSIIIQRLRDTTQYADLNVNNSSTLKDIHRWDSFYYSRKVGDTLYFKFILKKRFFKTKAINL